MLHNVKALERFSVHALDGDIGSVKDVYFDDKDWVVRYLVVDTGGWLTGRKVVLSPISVSHVDWENNKLHMNLTREKIQNSPGIPSHPPISRQQEGEIFRHYGYPYYWGGPYAWGYAVFPALMEQQIFEDPQRLEVRQEMEEARKEEQNLRSCNAVSGYSISATDGSLGHVEDFLFDEQDWSIQYMVTDPRNLWPGKHVLVSPQSIEHVYWSDKSVEVSLTKEEVENAPPYDPDNPPSSPRRTSQPVQAGVQSAGRQGV